MCHIVFESGGQPLLMTFWPDGDEMPIGGPSRNTVVEINTWILEDATNVIPSLQVLDTAEALTGNPASDASDLKREYHDGSYLHLNRTGYEILANKILNNL